MSKSEDTATRDIADDGTQRSPEVPPGGGRSSRGPALSSGGDQEPGGLVPPYEDRATGGDIKPSEEGYRDGVRVGGATGPVEDAEFKAPSPSETPGGRTASPADEQSAEDMPDGDSAEQGSETGSHVTGTPKGERGGE